MNWQKDDEYSTCYTFPESCERASQKKYKIFCGCVVLKVREIGHGEKKIFFSLPGTFDIRL